MSPSSTAVRRHSGMRWVGEMHRGEGGESTPAAGVAPGPTTEQVAEVASTSPQKPPATYTRVNDFRPHRDSHFRGATYIERHKNVYFEVSCCKILHVQKKQ